jgi:hypothetical protein
MTDITTLRTRLSEAETAQHKLLTGSLVEQLRHGDQETRYTRADLGSLAGYIASLRSQIAALEGIAAQRTRPINMTY